MENLNKKLDDLFADLELPTDGEIKAETHRAKVSEAKKAFWKSPKGLKEKELQKSGKKGWLKNSVLKSRTETMLKDRGVGSRWISPEGKEYTFNTISETNQFFKTNAAIHVPLKGARRCQRRKFKNWIVIRLDNSASPQEIQKLKDEVKLKLNPPRKERDIEAWKKKMEKWRNSPKGKEEKKQRKATAKLMGKKNAIPIMTPDGIFESSREAAKFYGIASGSMAQRLKDKPKLYYKIKNDTNA